MMDLFGFEDGVDDKLVGIEVFGVEVEGGDLVVGIGCVVEDALLEVVAGGIEGVFEFVVAKVATAVLLLDGVENVEELVDAGEFVGVVGGGCVLIASGLSGGLVFRRAGGVVVETLIFC